MKKLIIFIATTLLLNTVAFAQDGIDIDPDSKGQSTQVGRDLTKFKYCFAQLKSTKPDLFDDKVITERGNIIRDTTAEDKLITIFTANGTSTVKNGDICRTTGKDDTNKSVLEAMYKLYQSKETDSKKSDDIKHLCEPVFGPDSKVGTPCELCNRKKGRH